jgi:hypothetical protein
MAEEAEFGQQLELHTAELTKRNTADCGDDRFTLRLADGTNDPGLLRARIVPQLFGGAGLSTTKALVSANSAIVKDAKNMWEAYIMTQRVLKLIKQQDGGHEACGASKAVESSVAEPIEVATLMPIIGSVASFGDATEGLVRANAQTKHERLLDGFYSDWDPQKHLDYLVSNYPQNTSFLEVDPEHHAGGHRGRGIYLLDRENVGFAKNAMIADTGEGGAYCVTVAKMRELAYKLGGSDEERAAILIGFLDDTLHVGAGIVVKDMAVFGSALED